MPAMFLHFLHALTPAHTLCSEQWGRRPWVHSGIGQDLLSVGIRVSRGPNFGPIYLPAPGHLSHLWAERGLGSWSQWGVFTLRVSASTEPRPPEGSVDEGRRNLPVGTAQRVRRKGPTPKAQRAVLMAPQPPGPQPAPVTQLGQWQGWQFRVKCTEVGAANGRPGPMKTARTFAEHISGSCSQSVSRAANGLSSSERCQTCARGPGCGFPLMLISADRAASL